MWQKSRTPQLYCQNHNDDKAAQNPDSKNRPVAQPQGFEKTGLGERVATLFVQAFGKSTLGLAYG